MPTNSDRREAAEQKRRQKLNRTFQTGRIVLLILLVVSVFNQLLLLLKVDYHIFFSASMPYYLNWLAGALGGSGGITFLKVFAVLVTVICYGGYAICWIQSSQQREFLRTALLLYAMDTLMLVIFAFVFIENPISCLLEILVHLVALWLLYNAHCSAKILADRKSRARNNNRTRGGKDE